MLLKILLIILIASTAYAIGFTFTWAIMSRVKGKTFRTADDFRDWAMYESTEGESVFVLLWPITVPGYLMFKLLKVLIWNLIVSLIVKGR